MGREGHHEIEASVPDLAAEVKSAAAGLSSAPGAGASEETAPLSSGEIAAIIRAGYAAEPVDFAALERATGLKNGAIKTRAWRMGLSDRARQRRAAGRRRHKHEHGASEGSK